MPALLSFGRTIVAGLRSGAGVSEGGITAIEDVLTDPRVALEHRGEFAELGIRSPLGAPVFKDASWVALLVLHHGRAPDPPRRANYSRR